MKVTGIQTGILKPGDNLVRKILDGVSVATLKNGSLREPAPSTLRHAQGRPERGASLRVEGARRPAPCHPEGALSVARGRLEGRGEAPQDDTVVLQRLSTSIFVLSSKAVATAEGRIFDLSSPSLTPRSEAKRLSEAVQTRTPQFCEAVLQELARRGGRILGTCRGAVLTDVAGILIANAGLDESNTPEGHCIGWPEDPVTSASTLRTLLERSLFTSNSQFHFTNSPPLLAVIISDSCLMPRRMGVVALALTCSGFDPIRSEIGQNDIHGKPLTITTEALADQLAIAANFVMGNANQGLPACLILDHGIQLTEWTGWVPSPPRETDIFRDLLPK